MKSAVTVNLIPEARSGPFVFHDDLAAACEKAHKLGFDAVEIFPPGAGAIEPEQILPLLQRHRLKVAAIGTGGGWVKHQLTLTSPDGAIRSRAMEFVHSILDAAAHFGAATIVGSMQGKWGNGISREAARRYLSEALDELGERANSLGIRLLYEPLNRYETNMANSLAETCELVRALKTKNVKILADLFHMNIEEADLAESIRMSGDRIGHIHLADSNRRPAGEGHTDFAPVAEALRDIRYEGYVSAECFPWPDSDSAAAKTMEVYRKFFA